MTKRIMSWASLAVLSVVLVFSSSTLASEVANPTAARPASVVKAPTIKPGHLLHRVFCFTLSAIFPGTSFRPSLPITKEKENDQGSPLRDSTDKKRNGVVVVVRDAGWDDLSD